MNSLPFDAHAFQPSTPVSASPPVPSPARLAHRRRMRRMRAIFRFPREMHIPLRAIAIHFDVMPKARWLRRSFRAWFSASPAPEPAWMRDAKA